MNSSEMYILLTNITSIAIYIVILSIIFIFGYINRATNIYNTASKYGYDKISAFAWYPFTSSVTMAKLADCNFLPSLVTSVIAVFTTIGLSALCIVTRQLHTSVIIIITVVYTLYSLCHYFVLKAYMNKFYPDKSETYILFSSFVPFFKYLIHINFVK